MDLCAKSVYRYIQVGCNMCKTKGGKVSPNPFVCPNSSTLIEPKPTQLLVGLNGYQPN